MYVLCVCVIVCMIYKAFIMRFIGQVHMHSISAFE